ncbi:hypothetical protein H4R34_002769 [Dimargaris verticillata]|uniref:C2H2-type domain-containing protein n=1 Tax=Dimargaris verticillata TaxID=2761393 RepID=A0A9W8B8V1_9FUNG|nr:hypothetical protein H4R34_002769 [Dimargaris verticillata]
MAAVANSNHTLSLGQSVDYDPTADQKALLITRDLSPDTDGPPLTKRFECPYQGCTLRFGKRSRLVVHIRTHTGEQPFVCPEPGCDKAFARAEKLRQHQRVHLPYVQRPFACTFPGCTARFTVSTSLKKHTQSHELPKTYQCTVDGCTEAFAKKFQLRRHVVQHTDGKPHACDYPGCAQRFQYPSQLTRHQAVHNPQGPPKYLCAYGNCLARFHKWHDLVAHNRTAHPLQCTECQRVLNSKRALGMHMATQHGNYRPQFACPWEGCDRVLSTKSNLKTHVKSVHYKDRPYACRLDYCAAAYSTKKALLRHKMTEHAQECHSNAEQAITTRASSLSTPSKRAASDDASDSHITVTPTKRPRRTATATAQSSHPSSSSAVLTGFDYADVDATHRRYACPIPQCPYRYVREKSLVRHLLRAHPLQDGAPTEWLDTTMDQLLTTVVTDFVTSCYGQLQTESKYGDSDSHISSNHPPALADLDRIL